MRNGFYEGNGARLDKVYKGVIVDTGEVVSVERVQYNCDTLSLDKWLKVLPGLHHKNVMGYVGYCYEDGERILVFEYMPNYTLAGWLLGDEGVVHVWAVRRNICLGVANGIHHLQTDASARIIRRSINVRTIFLDANFELKIGGFWRDCSLPEPGSEKEDVYNFGVVLLQIVSGRIRRRWNAVIIWRETMEVIINSTQFQPTEKIEAIRFIRIALLCIHSVAATRPDMALVIAMLRGNRDEEIESLGLEHERETTTLGLEHEREISQFQRRIASLATALRRVDPEPSH